MEGVQPRAMSPEEESSVWEGCGLWRCLSEVSKDKCEVTILGALIPQLLAKNIPSSMHPVILDSQASLASPKAQ